MTTAQGALSVEAECLVDEADIVLHHMIAVAEATAGTAAVVETATAGPDGETELALRPLPPEKLYRAVV